MDYNLWSGPQEPGPILRERFHYDWHWKWAYGNGDLGNQGVHQMDLCNWILGVDALPPRVVSLGGRFGYDDDGEKPNTQTILLDYPDAPLVFEARGLADAARNTRTSASSGRAKKNGGGEQGGGGSSHNGFDSVSKSLTN